jgi:hypothetical protein
MVDATRAAQMQPDPNEPEPRLHAALRSSRKSSDRFRWLIPVALLVAGALYFFQSATLAPDHTDEGLILQYIDAMARGQRSYYDFVDTYGIANWVMPVLFYDAFDHRVWGIRMWLVLVKMLSLVIAFVLVRRLATGSPGTPEIPESAAGSTIRGDLYGALAVLWMAILLGARWPSLQTAYASINVIPLMLSAWYFILCAPFANRFANIGIAGILTTLAIWTKLNAGMYLLAGGLFAYFFWLPAGRMARAATARPQRWFRLAGSVGLVSYLVVFTLCIWNHYSIWFFLYLTLPLILALVVTYSRSVRGGQDVDLKARLTGWLAYFAVSVALSLLVLFGYYGRYAGEYVDELAGIISTVDYTAPFPPLGQPGQYVGLTEYYWLQLPWAVTLIFVLWAMLGIRHGSRAFGSAWPARMAKTAALFVFFVLHAFVMYARCDEMHIFPVVVFAPVVLFVLLADLEAFLAASRARLLTLMRGELAVLVIVLSSTLVVVPSASDFMIGRGDWDNPKLEHLRFRSGDGKYKRPESPHISDTEWDLVENDASNYIRSIVAPNEPILLLTSNRLLHFNSDTISVGGRYHYHLFLACFGFLDRDGFDKLVPHEIIDEIVANPPRVIVSAYENSPLGDVFPEFEQMRDSRYVKTRNFRHILIYELRDDHAKL